MRNDAGRYYRNIIPLPNPHYLYYILPHISRTSTLNLSSSSLLTVGLGDLHRDAANILTKF